MNRIFTRLLSSVTLCGLLLSLTILPASAARFTDVPQGHWAADAVSRCVELGFFQGESQTRFGVGKPMSRGAFVVVLNRFFGWEAGDPATLPFNDVPKDAWYAPALAAALERGAVAPQAVQFRPADPLTREELAAALVRSLGFAPLSGMAQELESPFQDVQSNRGYITMAYDLGLVNGTGENTFSPEKIAGREQVAVILMRLYDKLHRENHWSGILSAQSQTPLTGASAIAVGRGQLVQGTNGPLVNLGGVPADVAAERAKAKTAGAKQLLYVSCRSSALERNNPEESAQVLAKAVSDGGYDGLFLDAVELRGGEYQRRLNLLVKAVKIALEDKILQVAAEGPGRGYTGYDYEVLSLTADTLVLRFHSPVEEDSADIVLAPVEPLEEIYASLRELKEPAQAGKLAIWMSTTATVWDGKRPLGQMTGKETEALLERPETKTFYSQRYGCSYLTSPALKDTSTGKPKEVTVWYPDAQSAQARVVLGSLYGVDQFWLSDMTDMSVSLLDGLK